MDNIIEELTTKCADCFGVDEHKLYTASLQREIADYRYLLWYILHNQYNVPISSLIIAYQRKQRWIFRGIAKIRDGMINQKYYKELYNKFTSYLNDKENEK